MLSRKISWVACGGALVGMVACGSSTTTSSDHDGGATSSTASGARSSASNGGSGSTSMSGSSKPPPPASVALAARLSGGDPSCNVAALDVGTYSNTTAFVAVPTGSEEGGSTVSVSCAVTPNAGGAGYKVNLNVSVGGESLQVDGDVLASGTSSMIEATFTDGSNVYTSGECTLALAGAANPAITTGRIWATLDCADLTSAAASCAGSASFVFENCE